MDNLTWITLALALGGSVIVTLLVFGVLVLVDRGRS